MIDESPWKPCDLRGVFPSAISENLFRRIGLAAGPEIPEGAQVVVGGDFRFSTVALKTALIEGLVATGLDVIDVGHAPTPVVYFAAAKLNAAGVFIVTASHNPPAHNGLKWMIAGRPPAPEDMARIRAAVESGLRQRQSRGRVDCFDPGPAYVDWITGRWESLKTRHRGHLVLDAGNGAWSLLGPRVFRELGFSVTCLHCEPDGSFPNRLPDCARTENLAALRAAAREQHALGIAWDGDGDRVAFVDESGVHASTDEISILLARDVLTRAAAAENVVCDIKLSDSVRRDAIQHGGLPMLERSGHSFMRTRLLANDAVLGLDACGHYFFREAGSRDDGLYSAMYMIGMLNGEQTLGELRQTLEPIFSTPELRLPASILQFDLIRDRLRRAFHGAEESDIDGIRLLLDDGVVLARESSTEPVVSLRVEGFSGEGYQTLLGQCLKSLPEAEAVLRSQIGAAVAVAG